MSGFADELHEVFERFGRIELRRMFGGQGVYHQGRMFALVAGDRLYIKTDEVTRPQFEALRLPPFEYERQGKVMQTSYFEPPPEVFEDREEAARWARLAWEATLRSGTPPKPKSKATAKKSRRKPKAA